jgi:hypothetical protein
MITRSVMARFRPMVSVAGGLLLGSCMLDQLVAPGDGSHLLDTPEPVTAETRTVSGSLSTLTASPATITASAGSSTATITVTARDQDGDPVNNALVTVAASGGSNAFNPASGRTNASGTFETAFSATAAGARTISVAAGAPTRLTFSVQPSRVKEDKNISPPVEVTILDASGNLVTSYTGAVTISIAEGPGNGTISGTRTRNAVAGKVVFNQLRVNREGTGYKLRASAAGLAEAISGSFDVDDD